MSNKLKKALNRHFIQTVGLYVFWYLFYSFVEFELINPFKWILDIPTYEPMDRFGLLLGWIGYNILSLVIHNNNP